MKVLVYGLNGWIGGYVEKFMQSNNINYIGSNFRVDDEDNIEKELNEINPTHLLSIIGRTHGKIGDKVYPTIDYLEEPGKLVDNIRDNLYSPIFLASLAKKYHKHFTYFGTGCIFNYDDTHPFGEESNGFTELDKPNFFGSSYSIVKGFTDRLMHLFESNVLNLRIRMPITNDLSKRNFITKISTYKKVCSIPNSMSVLPDLIPIMFQMMNDNLTGTYNFTNPGLISHNEILQMYQEIVNPDFKWVNFTIDEQDRILASKRSNNFLSTYKIASKYQVPNIKDSVRNMLEQIKIVKNN
jgi:dTDP-4-dehydrorhamnose reductase